MASTKTKRRIFTAVTALLYIGMPVFVVLQLYPAWTGRREDMAAMLEAEETLGRWVHMAELPTQTRIDVVRGYKKGMQDEYDRVVAYFRQRSANLDRTFLGTETGDPVHVKLKFEQFKQILMRRAVHSIAQAGVGGSFMPAYPWEQPNGLPPRSSFELIEKKAAVADLVVRLLGNKMAAVSYLAIGDPVEPDGTPIDDLAARRLELSATESDQLTHVVWPVRVELLAQFPALGGTLNALSTPAARQPCVLLSRVEMTAVDRGTCTTKVNLGILEFD